MIDMFKSSTPPRPAGLACVETAFPSDPPAAVRAARGLGCTVTVRQGWNFVPQEAVGRIAARLALWAEHAPNGWPEGDYVTPPHDETPLTLSHPAHLPDFVPEAPATELPPLFFSDPEGWPDGVFGPAPEQPAPKGGSPVSNSPPPADKLEQDGFACLQVAFPQNWRTADHVARGLGFPVKTRTDGWIIAPAAAVQAIKNRLAAWERDMQDHRAITRDHVSHQILEPHVRFAVHRWAELVGAPVKQPTQSEDEYFVRVEDLPLIFAAARSSVPQPEHRVLNSSADAEQVVAWIYEKGLDGLTLRQARARKLIN